jgi:dUTP pyrophosphatase
MPTRLLVKRLRPGARLPSRATPYSTGLDLHACLDAPIDVGPDPTMVPTGLAIEVPPGFDAQVRPRSGLASKGVLSTFGTIDADYRGEVFVTLYTLGGRGPHTVRHGDRIAQLVIGRAEAIDPVEVDELTETGRGAGGHGSTGV